MNRCELCGAALQSQEKVPCGTSRLCPLCERKYLFYLSYFHEAWSSGYFPNLARVLNDFCLREGYQLKRFSRILLELYWKKQLSLDQEYPDIIRIRPYAEPNPESQISLVR